MIRNEHIWKRYLSGEIIEQSTSSSKEIATPKFGADLINKIESDIKTFNPSILEKMIDSFEKKQISDVYTHIDTLKIAENASNQAEDKGLEYLYGYIIPIIKTGHGLDSYITAKTHSVAERFNDSYSSLQKAHTTADTAIYQKACRSDSELLVSLVDLAEKRNIEIDINSKTSKYLHEYRAWSIKCDNIDHKIDTLIEAYRSLELIAKDEKTLKKLKRPISKRFGLFKGHILKKASSLNYIAGLEQCETLSQELDYVKENIGKVYNQKQDIKFRLKTIQDLSGDINSYAIPLSTSQLEKLTSIHVKDGDSTQLIYFKNMEKELKSLSDSNRKIVQSVIDKQKSYLSGVHDVLSKTLIKTVSEFKEIDSIISSIDSRTQELKEYLPQISLLNMNKANTDSLIKNGNELHKKLVESKEAYTSLEKNLQSLDRLERDTNKNDLSETRLNMLASIVQDSKTMPVIPISTLRKQYESEHKTYQNKIELFIDNIITKIDEQASNTAIGTPGSVDVLKYYEKVQTFRDISQKVKDYRNLLNNYQGSNQIITKTIYKVGNKEPKTVEIVKEVNPHSIIDMLKTVELPDDNRYWIINDILEGKRNSDGWMGRIELLRDELHNLKNQDDLIKTDYVLNIARIVDDSYKNGGNLSRLASVNVKNNNAIKSLVIELNDFGKRIAS